MLFPADKSAVQLQCMGSVRVCAVMESMPVSFAVNCFLGCFPPVCVTGDCKLKEKRGNSSQVQAPHQTK